METHDPSNSHPILNPMCSMEASEHATAHNKRKSDQNDTKPLKVRSWHSPYATGADTPASGCPTLPTKTLPHWACRLKVPHDEFRASTTALCLQARPCSCE